jgi:uncharacterized Zn finger protein
MPNPGGLGFYRTNLPTKAQIRAAGGKLRRVRCNACGEVHPVGQCRHPQRSSNPALQAAHERTRRKMAELRRALERTLK